MLEGVLFLSSMYKKSVCCIPRGGYLSRSQGQGQRSFFLLMPPVRGCGIESDMTALSREAALRTIYITPTEDTMFHPWGYMCTSSNLQTPQGGRFYNALRDTH